MEDVPKDQTIKKVIVLGAGSAGLMTALALRRRVPGLEVTVVRSPELGVIGVGEGSTAAFPRFLFDQLGLSPQGFYSKAQPTWKLGLKFLWGPRPEFYYTFETEIAGLAQGLGKPRGFYCSTPALPPTGRASALMMADRAFWRQANGAPDLTVNHSYHIENRKLTAWLEETALALGIRLVDGLMEGAETGPEGIRSLQLDGGRCLQADLYVDCSGFRAELAGKALGVPFDSFAGTLFCDRAVIGGWERGAEPVHPYTTCETMEAGWAWQIEHEHFINRGYVFSSHHLSDEQATAELLAKNPQMTTAPRVVKFRSGRLRQLWTKNVVVNGNAGGFVEPLEATSLQAIGTAAVNLADMLRESGRQPTPSLTAIYNAHEGGKWDDIRDFLAVHYRFNTRKDTPFWKQCREETPLHGAAGLVEYYQENGPLLQGAAHTLSRDNSFGLEGYYALLVGQQVPHRRPHAATRLEETAWSNQAAALAQQAAKAMTVPEALAALRDPRARWGS